MAEIFFCKYPPPARGRAECCVLQYLLYFSKKSRDREGRNEMGGNEFPITNEKYNRKREDTSFG
jgi:hypothetical protein